MVWSTKCLKQNIYTRVSEMQMGHRQSFLQFLSRTYISVLHQRAMTKYISYLNIVLISTQRPRMRTIPRGSKGLAEGQCWWVTLCQTHFVLLGVVLMGAVWKVKFEHCLSLKVSLTCFYEFVECTNLHIHVLIAMGIIVF